MAIKIIKNAMNIPLNATLNIHLINLGIIPEEFKSIIKYDLFKLGFGVASQSRILADAHDFYELGASVENNNSNSEKIEIHQNISEFRKYAKSSKCIIANNLHWYSSDSLEATIIDNATRVHKEQPRKVIVPDYSYKGARLNEVLSTDVGLKYLQVLFNTSDDASKIKDNLFYLTGNPLSRIKLWTPIKRSREDKEYNDMQSPTSGAITGLWYLNNEFNFFNNYLRADVKSIAFEKIGSK
ncbi:MAG: hypothetical protein WC758_04130 [Candidatus Woesearchaeota archaeon]|jgi:hypothetical protein